jgi:agmatinase
MRTFAGVDQKYSNFDDAAVLLQSIPYDGTSTWGKGADGGFAPFLDALENMELYDIETDSEAYKHGVYILPAIEENESPESMFKAVYAKSRELLASGKYLTCFGGEHSVSIGVIKAHYEKYKDLTVLQLDAHADLRESYGGTPYNHACALHDASQNANLIQVGIRSADTSEMKYLNRQQCYFAEDIYGDESWMDRSIAQMTDQVYLTIDLDAFDPSIMPATGTPEPGGLLWNPTIKYLRKVFEAKTVVGFDITEFAPLEGQHAPQFLVAKLYYKLLSYKFKYNG